MKFSYFKKFQFFPKGPFFKFDWVVKDWFFDRDRVKNMLDDETRFALQRFGQEVMYKAKKSMPWRHTPSPPGQPPHAHKGKNGHLPPRGNIKRGPFSVHYSFDPVNRGVIIGPEKFPNYQGEMMVPSHLEYGGGENQLVKNKRRRNRKVGDAGIIRVYSGYPPRPKKPTMPKPPPPKASAKKVNEYFKKLERYKRREERYKQDIANWRKNYDKVRQAKRVRGIDGRIYYVFFAKLKTPRMVQRARKLEEKIYGPLVWKLGRVAPRPYMRPAFKYKLQFLPRYYQDAKIKASKYNK